MLRILCENAMASIITGSGRGKSAKEAYNNIPPEVTTGATYLMIWGPPMPIAVEDRRFVEDTNFGCPILGASTTTAFSDSGPIDESWVFAAVKSEYITATSNIAKIPDEWNEKAVDSTTNRLVEPFCDYFEGPKQPLPLVKGGHDVTYRRPAMLILITPGCYDKLTRENWTHSDKDYDIVEALSVKSNKGLMMFGGSASSNFDVDRKTWTCASIEDGNARISERSVSAMLISTDLNFGMSCKHGFELVKPEFYCTAEAMKDSSGEEPNSEYRRSRPRRYHSVGLSKLLSYSADEEGENQSEPPEISLIPDPKERDKNYSFANEYDSEIYAYITRELGQSFLNVPYFSAKHGKPQQKKLNWATFLRPVEVGTRLHLARADSKSLETAPRTAFQSANEAGLVGSPRFSLLCNCVGRKALIGGNQSAEKDFKEIATGSSTKSLLVTGFYCDGETCTAPNGLNFHHNWTSNVLSIGADFCETYLSESTHQFANELLEKLSKRSEAESKGQNNVNAAIPHEQQVLERLAHYVSIVTQTDWVHFRTLSWDGKELGRPQGKGVMPKIPLPPLNILKFGDDSNSLAHKAFHELDPTPRPVDSKKYFADEDGYGKIVWEKANEEQREQLGRLEWLASIPIRLGKETLGIVSINSEDEDFDKYIKTDRIVKALGDLFNHAALLIETVRKNKSLQTALVSACKSTNPKDLAESFVQHAAALLGRKAFLSVLLAPDSDSPDEKVLKCFAISGPSDEISGHSISVPIGKHSTKEERGICGGLFLSESYDQIAIDEPSEILDYKKESIHFKPCVEDHNIKSVYAIKLVEKSGSEEVVVGILNAEAPSGVLSKNIHIPILRSLGDACVSLIAKQKERDVLEFCVSAMMPPYVAQKIKTVEDWNRKDVRPTRRYLSILYADIRNYTRLSNIIGEERLLPFVRRYYDLVGKYVSRNNGHIDKFMGDGVFALFGLERIIEEVKVSSDGDYKALMKSIRDAVKAGRKISEKFRSLADEVLPQWRKECPEIGPSFELNLGTSIHVGNPLVGLFHAGGNEDPAGHLTHTAIGRDVNLAARLGNKVKGNKILLSSSVYEFLKEESSNKLELDEKNIETLKIKGFGKIECIIVDDM